MIKKVTLLERHYSFFLTVRLRNMLTGLVSINRSLVSSLLHRSFPSTSSSVLRGWKSLVQKVWMNWCSLRKTPFWKTWTMSASLTTTGWERPSRASPTVFEGFATSSWRWRLNSLEQCDFLGMETPHSWPPNFKCSELIFEMLNLSFFHI